ncbi:MAG: Na+/H+ antiporter NhaA [Candidatus Thorarchaeota archaeon]
MPETEKRFKKGKPVHPTLHRTIRPFREFMKLEASGGTLILGCVVIALLWANLPFGWTYDLLWETQFSITLGASSIEGPLVFWINDFLMAIFFFLIGLEIKRELLIGWLSKREQALLPLIGAAGGMIFPAAIYLIFNPPGSPGSAGWAIPMATDIAICLGLIALLGKQIPIALKVFLTTLAIADDIGGIIVIAIFYSHGIHWEFLVLAGFIVLFLAGANRLGIRPLQPYIVGGIALWVALLFGGIHPTLAGVLLAGTVPATTKIDYLEFKEINSQMQERIEKIVAASPDHMDVKSFLYTTQTVEKACHDVEAPLQRIDAVLAPWVVFLIVPMFALANAGITLEADFLAVVGNPVALGVIFGLVLGKPLGVLTFVWISERLNIVRFGDSINWDMLSGVALLTGIGFTISLFIGGLSFQQSTLLESAKVGILLGSFISGILAMFRIRAAIARNEDAQGSPI